VPSELPTDPDGRGLSWPEDIPGQRGIIIYFNKKVKGGQNQKIALRENDLFKI
jgi:hypothetical protein